MNNYTELEKKLAEQAKQIDTLKRGMIALQQRLAQVTKKTERSYHTGRNNSNDINTINGILRGRG